MGFAKAVPGGSAHAIMPDHLAAWWHHQALQMMPRWLLSPNALQAGGKNESKEVKMPAGLPRLFKSPLDWNLYSSLQEAANDRQASACGSTHSPWPAKARCNWNSLSGDTDHEKTSNVVPDWREDKQQQNVARKERVAAACTQSALQQHPQGECTTGMGQKRASC